jgi:hypothetical protein
VHPLAASATTEPGTGGLSSIGSTFNNAFRLRKINSLPLAYPPKGDDVARSREGNKYDTSVQVAEAKAARDEFFN